MFEELTSKNILNNMKENAPDDIDVREGSVFFDSVSPFSKELAKKYIHLDKILLENFIETAEYENTVKRTSELNIINNESTNAKYLVQSNIEIPIGATLRGSTYKYTVLDAYDIENNTYIIKCHEKGTLGNYNVGKLTPIENINGLKTIKILGIYEQAYDVEKLDVFKKRYSDEIASQNFTGSISDYNLFLNSNFIKYYTKTYYELDKNLLNIILKRVDGEKISSNELDEISKTYNVPIMQRVNFYEVLDILINISFKVEYEDGYSKADIYDEVLKELDVFFDDLSNEFTENTNIIIRISQIEMLILNIVGVKDIFNVLANGSDSNITIDVDKIPLRGDVIFD